MKRLAVIAVLLLAGCLKPSPQPLGLNPEPTVTVDRAAVCDEIAAQIDAGRVKTSDDLVRLFGLLTDAGHWTKDDSAAVDAMLPGLPAADRALTADDAEKLRTVK